MNDRCGRSERGAHAQIAALGPGGLEEDLERFGTELREAIDAGTVPRAPSLSILERIDSLRARVQAGTEQNSPPEAES